MNYSKEEKAKLLEGWKKSGKSISTYVKDMGLVRWTFTKWLKAYRKENPRFVEVAAPAEPSLVFAPELLIEKGDVKIHVPLTVGRNELYTVIDGLRGIL